MLNHIVVAGRLTKDPEMRMTQNGIAVCSFTLAVNRDRERDKADFLPCVAWRQTAELVQRYLGKGRQAAVSGRLQIRDWTDKDGNKRQTAEIQADSVYFLDSKPKTEDPEEAAYARAEREGKFTPAQKPVTVQYDDVTPDPSLFEDDDDLPF